jgi:hypothetical protein
MMESQHVVFLLGAMVGLAIFVPLIVGYMGLI